MESISYTGRDNEDIRQSLPCTDTVYGYVYITENLINHKRYIGQHKATEFDAEYKGSGYLLRKAFDKYGIESFSTEILEWCSSREELNTRERYWIKKFNATDSEEFYNMTRGGEGGDTLSGLKGKRREEVLGNCSKAFSDLWKTEVYRNKVLSGMKKYWEDDEHHKASSERNTKSKTEAWRKNQSLKMTGKNNPLYGKHWNHTEEAKKKISDKTKGKNNPMYGKPSPCRKKIMCVETGEVFDSVSLAAEHIGRDESYLCRIAKRYDSGDRSAMTRGYHWSYYKGE